ncbi:cupin [Thiosulfatimonas sediminis]|uniref:Cupin n=1 Tax=Thiosulfatimonas sediminis TaxID=2675054 RepID=A0A6F8PVD4_9GAMM|nr:cupin domain-containing protein [Thiosulfatimonas sediminis]BBP46056.1 cupin [Thiosulfatimonas sediminis]
MLQITVLKNPSPEVIASRGCTTWPIWEKAVSEFPWYYADNESCWILDGEVTVTPDGGEPVTIHAGDFVTFPAGLHCTWKITQPIRKHYQFF